MKIAVVRTGANQRLLISLQSYRPPCDLFSDRQSDQCDDVQRPYKCPNFSPAPKVAGYLLARGESPAIPHRFRIRTLEISLLPFCAAIAAALWIFGGLGPRIQQRLHNAHLGSWPWPRIFLRPASWDCGVFAWDF